jgi:hypothetical protein
MDIGHAEVVAFPTGNRLAQKPLGVMESMNLPERA